jgi:hypothetical protein
VESPAKLAPTPVAYVPALIPLKEALAIVAAPVASVVAEPAGFPFNVKLIDFPLTGEPPEVVVKVAESMAIPPYIPLAAATDRVVAGLLTVRSKKPLLVACVVSPPYVPVIR